MYQLSGFLKREIFISSRPGTDWLPIDVDIGFLSHVDPDNLPRLGVCFSTHLSNKNTMKKRQRLLKLTNQSLTVAIQSYYLRRENLRSKTIVFESR